MDSTTIGYLKRSSAGDYISGSMAHPAIWNVALTGNEIKQLAQGLRPDSMRRPNLVAYWPLNGNYREVVAGRAPTTLVGAPTFGPFTRPDGALVKTLT
jgi:hypothetical protein